MGNSREILKKYVDTKSMYFTLRDGEEAKIQFLSVEVVPNRFDGGKTTTMRYHLRHDGVEKIWDRDSRQLAEIMSQLEEGETIIIKRTGEKRNTHYSIRPVD